MLLVACSDAKVDEKAADGETEVIEATVVEVKTEAEYEADFKSAVGFDALVAGTENSSVNPVDIVGDTIPEMVLIVNGDVLNAYFSVYQLVDDEWIEMDRKTYTSMTYVQLSFEDQLRYEDSSKAAFVIDVDEAGAKYVFKNLDVYMYDGTQQKLKRAVSFGVDVEYNEMQLLKANQFSFKDISGNELNYTFKNGQFIDPQGKRLGEVIDEELAHMLGTTINSHYLTLGENFEELLDKISEKANIEQGVQGNDCAQFPTFYFCDTGVGMPVSIFDIMPTNEVTAKQLEGYFGEPLAIFPFGDVGTDGYYFAEIYMDDRMYGMRFDSDSSDAKLELFSFATMVDFNYE